MTTTAVASSHEAAERLGALIPTATPLTVAAFDPAQAPSGEAMAVRAHFVGSKGADLVVVADEAVAAAVEAAGDQMSYADALRPALEAAASTLGAGVLDTAEVTPVGSWLTDPDVEAYALVDSEGIARAWFGMRVRVLQSAAAPKAAFPQIDPEAERARMRLLHDVELVLTAEIGHTRLPMRQVLDLVPGTVLELDRAAGSPADVMVNGRLVARGEVVVIDEDYGIRITEIVSSDGTH